jgi:hypothetical protein
VSRGVVHWYRALCFGEPCGPWRDSLTHTFADLEAQGLGSRDDHGTFFVTVPGDYEVRSAWVPFDEWLAHRRRAA